MINIRFHIVSITAVFLALAIGIFMGSTLLDRATVDALKARQSSIDSKIAARTKENDALRERLDSTDAGASALEPALGQPSLSNRLTDPVLLVAVRGIDEESVRALQEQITTAGAGGEATPWLGTVWLDERLDTTDSSRVEPLARVVGSSAPPDRANPAEVSSRLVDQMAEEILLGSPGETGVVERLEAANLVDWDIPDGGTRRLPSKEAGPYRVVLLSGEGASLGSTPLVAPLVSRLAEPRSRGLVVGEVMEPRSSIEEVDGEIAGDIPPRGTFVDQFRKDGRLAGKLVTVDDVDRPFGRLATVFVLAGEPNQAGHYGEAATAQSQFPG